MKKLETFYSFSSNGISDQAIIDRIKSHKNYNPDYEYSYMLCGKSEFSYYEYCQVYRTIKSHYALKKRELEFVLEQEYDDPRNIWERLLKHKEFDTNCEYVRNREINDCEGVFDIIYKIV